jgi:hypothetical protein
MIALLTISSCSKDNPSKTCPEHFSGSNCDQQEEPSAISITRIDVIKYPASNSGSNWDLDASGPDIFPVLEQNGITLFNSPTYVDDPTNPNGIYTFTPTSAITISLASQYTLKLYDYDNGISPDYMGGVIITPYSATGGYPDVKEWVGSNGISYKVYYSYSF